MLWISHIARSTEGATLFFFFILQFVDYAYSMTAFEKDLTLTYNEKVTLDKFRERIAHTLTQDYMKEDIWMVRWLRARDFDIDQAEEMLKESLIYRKKYRIDTILTEDWSEFNENYPYYLDTVDKNGIPILSGNIGEWGLRAAAMAGQSSQLIRYLGKIMEDAVAVVRKFQSQGKNVTRFDFLANMDNYNVVQQGCPQCLPFYIALVNGAENNYPGSVDKIVLINTPPMFEVVLRVIRPLMAQATRRKLQVLGQDRAQWTKVMLSIADKSQLRPEYGGTYGKKGE